MLCSVDSVRVGVHVVQDCDQLDKGMESKVTEIRGRNASSNVSGEETIRNELLNDQLGLQRDWFDVHDNGSGSEASDSFCLNVQSEQIPAQLSRDGEKKDQREHLLLKTERSLEGKMDVAFQCNTFFSESDNFVAGGKNRAMNPEISRALQYGFEVGDMVWGKVKSHPWWPGHIFNEAFASPLVHYTKKDGHVLVAFFGDSSYGWFDPAELIPFDLNFREKSQQLNSRTFVKAVAEAVDEASRRSALGLACKCRNLCNFRPTVVQGYFAIDIPGYYPGGIYSINQIKKARDGFKPSETLSFIKQLALVAPQSGDHRNITFVSRKALVFAFRKAVFEEFDETYAQAFGVQPIRHSRNQAAVSNEPLKGPSRAPLSGPLVIAEALNGVERSRKPLKIKGHLKKDKYLLQRRDGVNDSMGRKPSSSMNAYMEGSQAAAAGDFVLQKRVPAVSMKTCISEKHEQPGFGGEEGLVSSSSKVAASKDHYVNSIKAKLPLDEEDYALREMNRKVGIVVATTTETVPSDLSGKGSSTSLGEKCSKLSGPFVGGPGSAQPSLIDEGHGVKLFGRLTADGGLKKAKLVKRAWDRSAEASVPMEKKKKKRNKDNLKPTATVPQEISIPGKIGPSLGEVGGRCNLSRISNGELAQPDQQRQHDFPSDHHTSSAIRTLPLAGRGNSELKLPQVLISLRALAVNPFNEIERNWPAVQQTFLHFRSAVCQKSLGSLTPSEFRPTKAKPSSEDAKPLPSPKPVKPLSRFDDPTKVGHKRLQSAHQEENAAKKFKKIKDVKLLVAEKKAIKKDPESRQTEAKEMLVSAPPKPVKADCTKKLSAPSKPGDPSILVMKFPPQTSLPSVAELKARFARFGPLDHSALRVFWKSSTCRVVFRYKVDARAALKYATENHLFGNVNVRCFLRDLDASPHEVPDHGKTRADEAVREIPRALERPVSSPVHRPQPVAQLKSCLKKSSGNEGASSNVNGHKESLRVKFVLGGEDSRGEQLGGNRDNIKNASYGDGSSSSAIEYNKFQKVTSSPSVSIPSQLASSTHFNIPQFANSTRINIPPQCATSTHDNMPQSILNASTSNPSPDPSGLDISEQMLSLLKGCEDIVGDVTNLLGYLPYHAL